MENKYIIFKWRNCWQLIEFRCSVHRETIKIKDPILWFWSKANAPTQETAHTDGSVYIGNASICAPTFSIFLCPVSLLVSPYFIFSLSPSLTHWLFLPPSSFCLYLFLCCLCLFSFSLFCILPPSCPRLLPLTLLLCIPQYPPDRVIHLHWGDTCAVLTVRALTELEEGKQQPHDSKDTLSVGKHIRPSITEAHPTPPTL